MEAEVIRKTKEEEGVNLAQYGLVFLANWYWFLIAVVVALGIGVFYVMKTTPMYTRSTQLLIKDDDGQGGSGIAQEFENLGLVTSNSNLNNEMLTISAPVMMKEAVWRLRLDRTMTMEDGLQDHPLYGALPVEVKTNRDLMPEESYAFKLRFEGGDAFVLSDFYKDGEEAEGDPVSGRFGARLHTPVGDVVVTRAEAFGKELAGRTLRVAKLPLSAAGGIYSARLSVSIMDKDATILNLALTDEIPQRADDLLLALIDVYNEKWLEDKNRIADSSSKFISERLESLSKELGDVDADISSFKSRNLLPNVEAASAIYMERSNQNQQELLNLTNQLGMARYLREYMTDKSKGNMLLPSNTGIQSSGIEAQIKEYNELMLRRNDLVANSNEQDPLVQSVTEAIASMRSAILRSIDNLISQISGQIRVVEHSESRTNELIASSPRQEEHLLSVGRQQKVKEALYIFLLQKREETELSKAYTPYSTRIIQPPTGSPSPAEPRTRMVLLAALVIGLAVPAGVLFLREMFNTRVRGRKDLENCTVPFLGEVPEMDGTRNWLGRRSKHVRNQVVVDADCHDRMNEAFRMLRTNMDYFMGMKNGGKVAMVTSFNPGSGKTFIVSNLAKAVTLKGKRVILVDFDLRRKQLSKMIGEHGSPGVTSFLAGVESDMDRLIERDVFGSGCDLLHVGVVPPNPTELLLTDRAEELFERLRAAYDYIFIDCPPVDLVADASIIRKYADFTLFVMRVGLADKRLVGELQELYEKKRFNNLAVVLNASRKEHGSAYGYKYRYDYN